MRNSRLVSCLTHGSNHMHMEDKTSVNSHRKHSPSSQRTYRCAVCRGRGHLVGARYPDASQEMYSPAEISLMGMESRAACALRHSGFPSASWDKGAC